MAESIFSSQVESLKVLEALNHTDHAGRIHSRTKIDRNHVYNILRRLVKEGLVRKQAYAGKMVPGGQKYTYSLTGPGKSALAGMKQAVIVLFGLGEKSPRVERQMHEEDMLVEADFALENFIEDKYKRRMAVKAVVRAVRI